MIICIFIWVPFLKDILKQTQTNSYITDMIELNGYKFLNVIGNENVTMVIKDSSTIIDHAIFSMTNKNTEMEFKVDNVCWFTDYRAVYVLVNNCRVDLQSMKNVGKKLFL